MQNTNRIYGTIIPVIWIDLAQAALWKTKNLATQNETQRCDITCIEGRQIPISCSNNTFCLWKVMLVSFIRKYRKSSRWNLFFASINTAMFFTTINLTVQELPFSWKSYTKSQLQDFFIILLGGKVKITCLLSRGEQNSLYIVKHKGLHLEDHRIYENGNFPVTTLTCHQINDLLQNYYL